MAKYKISVCRFSDGTFHTMIDKILIYSNCKRKETIDLIESLAIRGGVDERYVKSSVKTIKKYHDLNDCWITVDNLHGYLGPGAYLIEKYED